jgi:hypothetical protein
MAGRKCCTPPSCTAAWGPDAWPWRCGRTCARTPSVEGWPTRSSCYRATSLAGASWTAPACWATGWPESRASGPRATAGPPRRLPPQLRTRRRQESPLAAEEPEGAADVARVTWPRSGEAFLRGPRPNAGSRGSATPQASAAAAAGPAAAGPAAVVELVGGLLQAQERVLRVLRWVRTPRSHGACSAPVDG